jgi:hypothetical protein
MKANQNDSLPLFQMTPLPRTTVGGHGSLLSAILKANANLTGALFDLPSVSTRTMQDRQLTAKSYFLL